jgi:hypothetical protein
VFNILSFDANNNGAMEMKIFLFHNLEGYVLCVKRNLGKNNDSINAWKWIFFHFHNLRGDHVTLKF